MLLRLQALYLAASLAWLAANALLVRRGERPLTPTAGPLAVAIFAAYGGALLLGYTGQAVLYRRLMMVFAIVLGYGGVIAHLRRWRALDAYRGPAAWLGAMAINGFGLALNLAAALRGN